MTNKDEQVPSILQYADRLRARTRTARDGSWFALVVFGLVILGAMPFYDSPYSPANVSKCHSTINGLVCSGLTTSKGLLGSGLGSPAGTILNVSPWATTYWVIGIFVGICLVVVSYWRRSRSSGVVGRIWPFATIAVGALFLAVLSQGWQTLHIPGDFWIRGMQALLVMALGLIALAIIEHSWPFMVFVAGFVALALLSCLYDVSNLFLRLGIGATWSGNDHSLPNLILPALYQLVGGVAFLAFRRNGYLFTISLRRTRDGE